MKWKNLIKNSNSKKKEKKILDFSKLDVSDQEWFLKETWCDKCNEADMGMVEPILYIENGKNYIEGKCAVCGEAQRAEVIENQLYKKHL